MKKTLLFCFLVLFLLYFGTAYSAAPVKVDVLYMNHGPLMDTIKKMQTLFSGYGNGLSVSWHDFESEEGRQFMTKMGINQHVPLVIWIDGNPKATLGGKQITFAGFPTGSGPAFFQGKWTLENLKAAVNQATSQRK